MNSGMLIGEVSDVRIGRLDIATKDHRIINNSFTLLCDDKNFLIVTNENISKLFDGAKVDVIISHDIDSNHNILLKAERIYMGYDSTLQAQLPYKDD